MSPEVNVPASRKHQRAEEIHLHIGGWSCDSVSPLVETFGKAKQQLPNLKALTLSSDTGMGTTQGQEDKALIKTLGDKCLKFGIELSIIPG